MSSHYSETSAAPSSECLFCRCVPWHRPEQCHEVVEIEYHRDGTIKRVKKRGVGTTSEDGQP